MKLFVVPTPVGNLDDMTFRAIEVLKKVDFILAEDTRTSAVLINSEVPCGPEITSVINNLAALLPISIAASLTMGQCFFMQVVIGFYL